MPREREQVVVNLRDQAVELHLGGRVVVVPPFGEATVRGDDDRVLGQIEALRRRRLVKIRDDEPTTDRPPARKRAASREVGESRDDAPQTDAARGAPASTRKATAARGRTAKAPTPRAEPAASDKATASRTRGRTARKAGS